MIDKKTDAPGLNATEYETVQTLRDFYTVYKNSVLGSYALKSV